MFKFGVAKNMIFDPEATMIHFRRDQEKYIFQNFPAMVLLRLGWFSKNIRLLKTLIVILYFMDRNETL